MYGLPHVLRFPSNPGLIETSELKTKAFISFGGTGNECWIRTPISTTGTTSIGLGHADDPRFPFARVYLQPLQSRLRSLPNHLEPRRAPYEDTWHKFCKPPCVQTCSTFCMGRLRVNPGCYTAETHGYDTVETVHWSINMVVDGPYVI